jgi:hypothetical protein
MKTNTFKKYEFTADLYTFSVSQDAEGGDIRSYQFERNISLSGSTTGLGRMFVFFKSSEDDVIELCQLFNFRDAGGNEIRTKGVWMLTNVEPLFNIWGHREGFKGRLEYVGIEGG